MTKGASEEKDSDSKEERSTITDKLDDLSTENIEEERSASIVCNGFDEKDKVFESNEDNNNNNNNITKVTESADESKHQQSLIKEQEESLESLLDLADHLYQDDKLLKAARVLRQVRNSKECTQDLNKEHIDLIHLADECENLVQVLEIDASDDNDGWICALKNTKKELTDGEVRGGTDISYKTNDAHTELQLRLETPIHGTLLVPLISVLNESQLYYTWLPSWRLPPIKFGIRPVLKLKQIGRCSQVLIITFDPPWPLCPRELILQATAADDIDDNGDIVIKLDSLNEGDLDGLVPPVDENTIRLHFNGGFLLRKHPHDPKFILLQFYGHIQGSFSAPLWFIHFLVKTVVVTCWEMLLNITEEVKNGKREKHATVIQEKWDDLYHWVETRAADMLGF